MYSKSGFEYSSSRVTRERGCGSDVNAECPVLTYQILFKIHKTTVINLYTNTHCLNNKIKYNLW